MIFPDIRISSLQRDLAEKESKFHESKRRLKTALKNQVKPLKLVQNNLKPLLFTLATVLPVSKILGKSSSVLFRKKKASIIIKLLKLGWLWKLLKIVSGVLFKVGRPIANHYLKKAIAEFFKKNK